MGSSSPRDTGDPWSLGTWSGRAMPGSLRPVCRTSACTTLDALARRLLVDLDFHPRVIMQILRRTQINVTMEIYSQAPSPQTREALRRLSESLDS